MRTRRRGAKSRLEQVSKKFPHRYPRTRERFRQACPESRVVKTRKGKTSFRRACLGGGHNWKLQEIMNRNGAPLRACPGEHNVSIRRFRRDKPESGDQFDRSVSWVASSCPLRPDKPDGSENGLACYMAIPMHSLLAAIVLDAGRLCRLRFAPDVFGQSFRF